MINYYHYQLIYIRVYIYSAIITRIYLAIIHHPRPICVENIKHDSGFIKIFLHVSKNTLLGLERICRRDEKRHNYMHIRKQKKRLMCLNSIEANFKGSSN